MKKIWDAAGDKSSGTWEQVFGKNVPRPANDPPVPNSPNRTKRPADAELFNRTDEIFMAWNYSHYIGYVAAQGKKEYPLPMYVNTWLVQPNDIGAGDYPSGGPEPFVHDIWRGGPAIDILAPDIYLPDYEGIIKTYSRNGNPAWNPETGLNANNAWMGFTQLKLLCFSPFGVDGNRSVSSDDPFVRSYGFMNSISGAIAEAQGKPDAIKLIEWNRDRIPVRSRWGDISSISPPCRELVAEQQVKLPRLKDAAELLRVPRLRLRQQHAAAVLGCPSSTSLSCSLSTPHRMSITSRVTLRSRSLLCQTTSPTPGSLRPPSWSAAHSRTAPGSCNAASTATISWAAATTSPPNPTSTCPAPRYRWAPKPEAVVAPLTPRPSRRP